VIVFLEVAFVVVAVSILFSKQEHVGKQIALISLVGCSLIALHLSKQRAGVDRPFTGTRVLDQEDRNL
jgi:Na+/H+ antiporter NhaD/arsenite permease-like protein